MRTLRKQLFEPTLAFSCLEDLNTYLLDQCHQIIQTAKHPEDKSKTVAEYFHLSLVNFDGYKYSVLCHLTGKKLLIQTCCNNQSHCWRRMRH